MKGIKITLLVFLITSLTITGVSFIDDKIWSTIMSIIGTISFSIIGSLYSAKLINGSSMGAKGYTVVFVVFLLIVYWIYKKLMELQEWINSWQLIFKIIVPIFMVILIILVLIWIIYKQDEYENYS